MTDIKLKTCPFCGSEAEVRKDYWPVSVTIECSNVVCNVRPNIYTEDIEEIDNGDYTYTPIFDSAIEDLAIKWNTRF